ncbi:MAG: hypothetical protein A2V66_16190 [Ignavibacteria bacterium RBG_13_36_8]|nr:MAG: hypothetical protein A2V66_16190 [Ignavibacteria bacterium RBG_13_36_8]
MRKIRNPFVNNENYKCFACSPNNENGLQMEFYEDGDEVISFWKPNEIFQGWGTILHGGIQATLMDEIAAWTVFVKLETAGVTTKIEASFKRPLILDGDKLVVKAVVKEVENKTAKIHVRLYDSKEHQCTEGFIWYKIFSKEKAKVKLHYPCVEAFFDN